MLVAHYLTVRNHILLWKRKLCSSVATDHFRTNLLWRKFTVVTDHHALRWLHSLSPEGRMARWIMDLQEYSFDVRHRPGANNGNADALPRLPTSPSCATTVQTGYNLLKAQHDDPETTIVIQMKFNNQPRLPFLCGPEILSFVLTGIVGIISILSMASL